MLRVIFEAHRNFRNGQQVSKLSQNHWKVWENSQNRQEKKEKASRAVCCSRQLVVICLFGAQLVVISYLFGAQLFLTFRVDSQLDRRFTGFVLLIKTAPQTLGFIPFIDRYVTMSRSMFHRIEVLMGKNVIEWLQHIANRGRMWCRRR